MQLLQGCSCHFQAVRSLGGPFFCPCLSLPGLTLPCCSLQGSCQRPPSQPPCCPQLSIASPLSIEALYAAASGLQLPFSGSE